MKNLDSEELGDLKDTIENEISKDLSANPSLRGFTFDQDFSQWSPCFTLKNSQVCSVFNAKPTALQKLYNVGVYLLSKKPLIHGEGKI